MMKSLLTGSAAALAIVFAGTVGAADLKPEDQIKYRQAGYKFMSWNMRNIKENLGGDYNQDKVAKAANTIAAIANSGMGALFGPGTDKNIGEVETHVKPELFENMDEVGKLARTFIEAADKLAEVAAMGDQDEVKTAFGDLGQSCKACHDKFRKEEH